VVVLDSQGDTLRDQHSFDLSHRRDLGSMFYVDNRGLVELFLTRRRLCQYDQCNDFDLVNRRNSIRYAALYCTKIDAKKPKSEANQHSK
jgi:hypothetical protein